MIDRNFDIIWWQIGDNFISWHWYKEIVSRLLFQTMKAKLLRKLFFDRNTSMLISLRIKTAFSGVQLIRKIDYYVSMSSEFELSGRALLKSSILHF